MLGEFYSDVPRTSPDLVLSSHNGIDWLFYSEASRTQAGHPKTWLFLVWKDWMMDDIFSIGYKPDFSGLCLLRISVAKDMACGQRHCVATSVQQRVAWVRIFLSGFQIILILFSTFPFWWWLPAPQKLRNFFAFIDFLLTRSNGECVIVCMTTPNLLLMLSQTILVIMISFHCVLWWSIKLMIRKA